MRLGKAGGGSWSAVRRKKKRHELMCVCVCVLKKRSGLFLNHIWNQFPAGLDFDFCPGRWDGFSTVWLICRRRNKAVLLTAAVLCFQLQWMGESSVKLNIFPVCFSQGSQGDSKNAKKKNNKKTNKNKSSISRANKKKPSMPNVSNDLSQKLYATMEKHKEVLSERAVCRGKLIPVNRGVMTELEN